VRQLERNLDALGYDADGRMTVDDEYTWATAAAVRALQEDRGLEETGEMDKDGYVVLAARAASAPTRPAWGRPRGRAPP
jgi:peptidoglycan hydrolase-like protein with peptidoglycan-binding domain